MRYGSTARSFIAALSLTLATTSAGAQSPDPAPVPITIGATHSVRLGDGEERREVNVHLPADYARGGRYPVLYVVDGGLSQDFFQVAAASALNASLERSLPVIVVGVQTVNRRADLIGEPGGEEERRLFPTAGQAQRFRTFLRERVKPMIEATYRTTGDDAVVGESLAGLFIAETWLTEPALFDRYAAINPSLWWHDARLSRSAAGVLADGVARGPLLLSASNEGPITTAAVRSLAAAAGERACYVDASHLTHATTYHTLMPQVLQFLFPTSKRFDANYGFTVGCSRPAR